MKKIIFTVFVLFLIGLLALSLKTYLESDMNTYQGNKKNEKENNEDKDDNKDKDEKDEKDEKNKKDEEIELIIEPLKDCNLEEFADTYETLDIEDKIEKNKPFIYEIETVEGFNVPYINIDEPSIVEANKEFSKLANYIKANPDSVTKKGIEYNVNYILNEDKKILSIVLEFTDNAFFYKEALNIDLSNKCVYTFADALASNALTYNILKDKISKNYKSFTFAVETEDQLYNKIINNIDTFTLGISNQYADKIMQNACYYFDKNGKINLVISYKIMEGTGKEIKEMILN